MTLHCPGIGIFGDCSANDFPRSRRRLVWIGSANFSIAISLSAFCGSSIMDYPLIRRRLARDFLRLPCSVFPRRPLPGRSWTTSSCPFMIPRCCFRFEERRRFGCLEGVGSALGDDVPFAPFPSLLADLPGRHAILRKRLKE